MDNEELQETPARGRLRACAELVRLPNVFTAVADVVMGFLFVREYRPGDWWLLGALAAASAALYAGGTTLNDVFDYRADLEQRPERPLPSGRIGRSAAARFGVSLLMLGVAAAWVAAVFQRSALPGLVGTALAGCVLLYDAWAKRTPLGPPAMGACRLLNVLLGMSVAATAWGAPEWIVAGAIGLYVTGVTWFARTESRLSSRWQLAAGSLVMLSGIGLLASLPTQMQPMQIDSQRWYILMGLLALVIGWRFVRAVVEPRPLYVQVAVRLAILSIVILDMAAVYAARGAAAAIAVMLLLVPAMLLGQWVEST